MGENAPKNAKMMVYKKRLIDHHAWLPGQEGKRAGGKRLW